MATRKLIRLPMPEGGLERDVTFVTNHHCPQGDSLRRHGGEEFADCDELYFSVGVAGTGMPANTPFPVVSIEPCGACGQYIGTWFEWMAPKLFIP